MKKIKIKYIITLIPTIIAFLLSFYFGISRFTNTKIKYTYLYPVTNNNFLLTKILISILLFILYYLLFNIIYKVFIKLKEKDRFYCLYTEGFIISTLLLSILTFKNFPGFYTYDSLHILEYARHLKFIPWHNVWTSLYYIVSLSIFNHPYTVTLTTIILISTCIAYVYAKIFENNKTIFRYFLFAFYLIYLNIMYLAWPFRTTICSGLEIFLFFYLFFNNKKTISNKEFILISLLTAFIATYRSENILYLIYPFLLIKKFNIKNIFKTTIIIIIMFIIIGIPQKMTSNKYYNKEYLVLNMFEPLQYIIDLSDENDSTIINEKDTINKIIDFDTLKEYGTASFFDTNFLNTQHTTTSTSTKEEQSTFIKSSINIIIKHPKLFIKQKINNITSLVIGKTYFEINTLQKWKPYYFEPLYDKFLKEFNTTYKSTLIVKDLNTVNKLVLPIITLSLGMLYYLFKDFKKFILLAVPSTKAIAILLLAPINSFMYYYYLYLIGLLLFIYYIYMHYKLIKEKIKSYSHE